MLTQENKEISSGTTSERNNPGRALSPSQGCKQCPLPPYRPWRWWLNQTHSPRAIPVGARRFDGHEGLTKRHTSWTSIRQTHTTPPKINSNKAIAMAANHSSLNLIINFFQLDVKSVEQHRQLPQYYPFLNPNMNHVFIATSPQLTTNLRPDLLILTWSSKYSVWRQRNEAGRDVTR